MSVPFGSIEDFTIISDAAQMRAFDEAVAAYAKARVAQDQIGREVAACTAPAPDDMRQRLADAGHELFVCGEKLKAYAMVLAGGDLIRRSADLLEADQAGAI
ncbi:MAG: hypothetical protein AAF230_00035 [Pseudomonadota bacterium]